MSDSDVTSDVPEPTGDGHDEHEPASDGKKSPPPAPPTDNRVLSKTRFQRTVVDNMAVLRSQNTVLRSQNARSLSLLETIGEGISELIRLVKGKTSTLAVGSEFAIETASDDGDDVAQFSLANPSRTENQGFFAGNGDDDEDASSYGYGGNQSGDAQPFAEYQAAEAARNSEERRKDAANARRAAKARRAAQRAEWNKATRKAHWMLTGAPPISHNQSVMQSVLDKRVKVTKQVQIMLAELTTFKVRAFVPRDVKTTDEVPINERMYIMGQAVVNLAVKSIPTVPQVSEAERTMCLDRVKKIYDSFDSGLKLLTQQCEEYHDVVAEPATADLIAAMIDKDMADWTKRIHTACATTGPIMYEPPESASELPPVMVPVWKHLAPFLNSGSLAVASVTAAIEGRRNRSMLSAQSGSPGKSKTKAEDCRRFAKGKCNLAHCKYRHRKTGDAAGNTAKGGNNKRRKTDTTSSSGKNTAKKAKTAAATKAAEAAAGEPDEDESE